MKNAFQSLFCIATVVIDDRFLLFSFCGYGIINLSIKLSISRLLQCSLTSNYTVRSDLRIVTVIFIKFYKFSGITINLYLFDFITQILYTLILKLCLMNLKNRFAMIFFFFHFFYRHKLFFIIKI